MLLDLINRGIEVVLQKYMEQFIEDVKKELTEQGHVLTGKLRDSIRYEIQQLPDLIQAVVYMLDYGFSIDKGIDAADIPFSPGSGAGSSKYIDGLFQFWKLKGLDSDEALSAAFATANAHRMGGMPTQGSFEFSQNGRRTGFFSNNVDALEAKVDALTSDAATEVQAAIVNVIRQTVTKFDDIVINL